MFLVVVLKFYIARINIQEKRFVKCVSSEVLRLLNVEKGFHVFRIK